MTLARPLLRAAALTFVVLTVLVGGAHGAVSGEASPPPPAAPSGATGYGATAAPAPAVSLDQLDDDGDEDDEDDGDDDDDDDDEGASVLPEWWGLGGEATEAPYVGLVELGVTLLVVGVGGYSLGKRTGVVPLRYRRRLLQAHQVTVLAGVAATVPHFVFAEEWEGTGLLVGVLLAVEVASGVYGRHLHRHVVRLGRGDEFPEYLGRALDVSKRVLFRRWRRIHVLLTSVTALVLLVHVVTAVVD